MAEMTRIQVPMDDELMAALERYAKEIGMSKADVVKQCLWAEFGPQPPQD